MTTIEIKTQVDSKFADLMLQLGMGSGHLIRFVQVSDDAGECEDGLVDAAVAFRKASKILNEIAEICEEAIRENAR